MKNALFFLILLGVLFSATAQNASIGIYSIYETNNEYYLLNGNDTLWLDKDGITIKFQEYTNEAGKLAFSQDYNLVFVRETVGSYVNYKLSNFSNYLSVCDSIYNDYRVAKFIFDYRIKLYSFIPEDPDIADQWYLDQIDVFEAWDLTVGNENITVAVIDQGLFLDHEDIIDQNAILENVFHNPGEDDWTPFWEDPEMGNGIDDDANYKIDDWKGWNYCNHVLNPAQIIENNNVIPEKWWAFHGTAVSGVIAAKTNNEYDVAGIAGGNFAKNIGGAKILPIKITDWKWNPVSGEWEEVSSTASIPPAILYSVEMGANIINMSFGLSSTPPGLENIEAAFEYAYDNNNVLLVAAAGNEGYSDLISYPASSEYVIAVGATDHDDEETDFSNNGNELELAAPGMDIRVLDNSSTYSEYWAGTSFSSPMVAATAALMLSIKPNLTNIEIRNILRNTAEKVGSHTYDQYGWNKYLGYGRINTYYALCEVISMLPPVTVNPNDIWDEPVFSSGDIVVETGNTLTIKSTVFMGEGTRMIIKPGAKVIVDGGKLTNYNICGEGNNFWAGIEVWGNSTAHQFPDANGNYQQGYLELKNGAIIENASFGAFIGGFLPSGTYDYAKAGGIIQVVGNNSLIEPSASFINNDFAVYFLPYKNFHPINPSYKMPNRSYFTNTWFEVNDNLLNPIVWDRTHVTLYGVKGINFKGCTFTNQSSNPDGTGIQCSPGPGSFNNAGFNVSAVCTAQCIPCPESSLDKCIFENFRIAIIANNTGINTFMVNDAIFINNSKGIEMTNANNASILSNEFYLGSASDDEIEECGNRASSYGIYMDNCTGFAIEENYFTKAQGAPAGNYVGIYIAETQATDQVYGNTFEGLSYGNYAVGKNWKLNETWNGLAYYCNENTGNWRDFNVIKNTENVGGVQNPIGSTQMTAGNTFSERANSNFYNDGDHLINYYYYAPSPGNTNTPYYPDVVYRVTRNEVVGVLNQCLSHHGGGSSSEGGLVMTPEEKQQAELDFAANLTDYNNVKNLYDDLKDGGNTDATVNDIETAWPQDTWELRAELLGKSPHLSMEVLKTAADKTDVLPDAVLFEILAANPDELKKDELITYLEDKENPLPSYMIDILKQVATGSTYKTVLIQQMAYCNQVKTRAAYDIVRSLINDTITDNNELRNWFDNIGGKRADEQIIASYMSEGNFTNALSLANLMPSLYNYTVNELTEHTYYTDMLNLQVNIAQQGRTIFDLDSTEVVNLVSIAENSAGTAGAQAKGILEFAYGNHYCNCIEGDNTSYKSSSNINYNAFSKVFGPDIEVKPNPAGEWTTFYYSLPAIDSDGVIKISDVNGRIIESFVVSGTQGQKVWDSRKINNGVYFYTFEVNGLSKSGKIVISK